MEHYFGTKQESSAFQMKNRTFLIKSNLFIADFGAAFSLHTWHQHHSQLLLPVHLHHHRLLKTDMTEEFRFCHRRLLIQEILIVHPVVHKRIDREIAHTEGS